MFIKYNVCWIQTDTQERKTKDLNLREGHQLLLEISEVEDTSVKFRIE